MVGVLSENGSPYSQFSFRSAISGSIPPMICSSSGMLARTGRLSCWNGTFRLKFSKEVVRHEHGETRANSFYLLGRGANVMLHNKIYRSQRQVAESENVYIPKNSLLFSFVTGVSSVYGARPTEINLPDLSCTVSVSKTDQMASLEPCL